MPKTKNFEILSNGDIAYQVMTDSNEYEIQLFVIDKNMATGNIRWDTIVNPNGHTEHIAYYNIEKYQTVSHINNTFNQIYNQFYKKSKFSFVPDQEQANGDWYNYNYDDNCYYIRFDYVFSIKEDFSSLPVCDYFTSPFSNINSSHYHYGNKSSTFICSHETVVASNKTPYATQCSMVHSQNSFLSCPLYSFTPVYYSEVTFKKNNSEETLTLVAEVSLISLGTKVSASIKIKGSSENIHTIAADTYPGMSYDSISNEISELFAQVISSYQDNYKIINTVVNPSKETVSVTINNKSYISSLV